MSKDCRLVSKSQFCIEKCTGYKNHWTKEECYYYVATNVVKGCAKKTGFEIDGNAVTRWNWLWWKSFIKQGPLKIKNNTTSLKETL